MTDANLVNLPATVAAAEIARGAFSALDYVRAWLDRIAAVEPEIGAFAHVDAEHAMMQARERDEYRLSGATLGPLHGIPVAIKDIIDTRDYPTEFGSPLFAGRQPQDDATVVAKLRLAGAVILGKTVTTEFAYFHPGKTRNPHDVTHTPGGSSSGSAASVAAGMAPLAIGTQTNGSVIRPASFCGIYGMKPSKGLVSRAGVLPLSAAVDTVGPFARSLPDLALLLQTIAGYDAADPDTRPAVVPNFPAFASEDFPIPPRFAFMRTPVWGKAEPATQKAFEQLVEKLGDACIRIDLPGHYADAWKAHRTIMAAEMAHNLGAFADRGGEMISKVLRDLVAEGRAIGAVQYQDALDEARAIADSFAGYFQHCNAIIAPSARGGAPKGLDATGDPVFCTLWSLSGLPSLSLPLLEDADGMPVGVQLVGAPHDDARLLRTANWLVQSVAPKGRRKGLKS
jgi:Asp-tRNA(Asn)/Glu-tRNA(Gln) amidotransferase A subunit family amidase